MKRINKTKSILIGILFCVIGVQSIEAQDLEGRTYDQLVGFFSLLLFYGEERPMTVYYRDVGRSYPIEGEEKGVLEIPYDTRYRYEYSEVGKIPYLRLYNHKNFDVKFVFLHSDVMIQLIGKDVLGNDRIKMEGVDEDLGLIHSDPFFDPKDSTNTDFYFLFDNDYNIQIEASSYLKEGSISYEPENMLRKSVFLETEELKKVSKRDPIDTPRVKKEGAYVDTKEGALPWVEGVEGDGIGETITISTKESEFVKYVVTLYWMNGYVSYEKPYLYDLNGRVKKVKIYYTEKGKKYEQEYELEDTPNPQELVLPKPTEEDIHIEIMDVYKGTKYEDTAVHAIRMKYLSKYANLEY